MSVGTIRHVIELLAEAGWAHVVPGRGTFAAERKDEGGYVSTGDG